jgi:hypothetical protein
MSEANDLILDRLNQIHNDLGEFRTETTRNFSEYGQRVTALETQVEPFFENDGGRSKMQDQIDSLNRVRWYGMGVMAAITTGSHWILHKIGI